MVGWAIAEAGLVMMAWWWPHDQQRWADVARKRWTAREHLATLGRPATGTRRSARSAAGRDTVRFAGRLTWRLKHVRRSPLLAGTIRLGMLNAELPAVGHGLAGMVWADKAGERSEPNVHPVFVPVDKKIDDKKMERIPRSQGTFFCHQCFCPFSSETPILSAQAWPGLAVRHGGRLARNKGMHARRRQRPG